MHRDESSKLDEPAGRLQFSLRSLLVIVTISCLGLSLLASLGFPGLLLRFLLMWAWSGLVVAQGAAVLAASGHPIRWTEGGSRRERRRRWSLRLAQAAAIAPLVTFLLSMGSFALGSGDAMEVFASYPGWLGSLANAWIAIWVVLFFLNPASVLVSLASCAVYFRVGQEAPLLAVRLCGLLNSLIATAASAPFYQEVWTGPFAP